MEILIVMSTYSFQGLQIVIDTNVLMQDLGFVEDLRDEEFEGKTILYFASPV